MTDESDVEDDGKSRRHVMLRHESSGATAPLSPTSQSNAHAVVQQFIKDVQPRHIRSRQKEHITAFAKWCENTAQREQMRWGGEKHAEASDAHTLPLRPDRFSLSAGIFKRSRTSPTPTSRI